jgi:Ca2+-binding RTX toxin-like protein
LRGFVVASTRGIGVKEENGNMATFTAFQGTSDELGELVAITKGSEVGTPTSTSATFSYVNVFGDTESVTLTGSGFSGPIPTSSWHITQIDGFFDTVHYFTVNSFSSPVYIAGDVLYNATLFDDPAATIFSGSDLIIGSGIGSSQLFGFAGNDTIIAQGGNVRMDGDGGFDTLICSPHGHDVIEFTSTPDSNVNLETIIGFNGSHDKIELLQEIFHRLNFGGLTPGEFVTVHTPVTSSKTGADIIYNSHTHHLFYDSNGKAAGGLHLIADVVGSPHFVTSDFLVI